MDPKDFKQYCAKLPLLSQAQAEEVVTRISGLGKSIVKRIDAQDDWLFQGLTNALLKAGLVSQASLPALHRSGAFKTYAAVAPDLMNELDKLLKGHDKRIHRLAVAISVGEALIGWCSKRFRSVSSNTVLRSSGKTFEALDEAYPGYIASGLFHMILVRNP